jgi:hypothetical protein
MIFGVSGFVFSGQHLAFSGQRSAVKVALWGFVLDNFKLFFKLFQILELV